MNRFQRFSTLLALVSTLGTLAIAYADLRHQWGDNALLILLHPIVQLIDFIQANYILIGSIFLALILAGLLLIAWLDGSPIFQRTAKVFSIFGWDELKVLSENPVFKLSYASLIAIPLLIYFVKIGLIASNLYAAKNGIASIAPAATTATLPPLPNLEWNVPLNLKLSYFSAFSFALALVVLAVFCPKDIRTGASPTLASAAGAIPIPLSRRTPAMRALCTICYAIGLILLIVVLVRSAIYVFNA
jgi:hypothetical protein